MRQMIIQVPQGNGREVFDIAQQHQGKNLIQFEALGHDSLIDVVILHITNRQVESILKALEPISELQVTLFPHGVLALQPPPSETPQSVTDVEPRSSLEVFLAGLQSVGSWRSLLAYAAAGGGIAWIGLFTNSSFLLVAAMLIAPFAEPAMNVAIATARGDRTLLKQSLWRYFVALLVTIGIAGFLSLLFRQEVVTTSMISTSQVSNIAILLPLIGGAAGALNLVQAKSSSLVSGAAVGMLIAAALAPPAALVGMAMALGRWDMVMNGIFLLLLQLAGINVAAAIVFRAYGLSTQGARYQRGKQWVFPVSLGVSSLVILGLLIWQFSSPPRLQRSSQTQRATAEIQKVVNDSGLARLVYADVQFTQTIKDQNTLLSVLHVQRQTQEMSSEQIRDSLTQTIQSRLAQNFDITPLVSINVLELPTNKK